MLPTDPDSVEPAMSILSEEDLPTLLDLLPEVSHKWELIATYLKLPGIGAVRCKQDDPQNKLLEILRKWLARTTPAPTVVALVDTLRKPIIDEQKVALEVEKHFYQNPPGKL